MLCKRAQWATKYIRWFDRFQIILIGTRLPLFVDCVNQAVWKLIRLVKHGQLSCWRCLCCCQENIWRTRWLIGLQVGLCWRKLVNWRMCLPFEVIRRIERWLATATCSCPVKYIVEFLFEFVYCALDFRFRPFKWKWTENTYEFEANVKRIRSSLII